MASNQQVLDELRAQGYRVHVRHERPIVGRNPKYLYSRVWAIDAFGRWQPLSCGGETTVSIERGAAEIAWGAATCSSRDNFNKKIGLAIALGRAVKKLKENTPCRASIPE